MVGTIKIGSPLVFERLRNQLGFPEVLRGLLGNRRESAVPRPKPRIVSHAAQRRYNFML